jgi:sec-independent protein translocase protein TatB
MFGIGTTELLVILVVALIVIGPSKLPDVMRTIGKGLAEFRRVSTDVKSTLETEVRRAEETSARKRPKGTVPRKNRGQGRGRLRGRDPRSGRGRGQGRRTGGRQTDGLVSRFRNPGCEL